MSKRTLTPIYYDSKGTSPMISLIINLKLNRNEIPQICENLHTFVVSKRGASFYYPVVSDRTIICRYEWHKRWKNEPYAIKLGFILSVKDKDLDEVQAYVTTNEITKNRQGNPFEIEKSPRLFNSLKKELVQTLENAVNNSSIKSEKQFYPIFYLEMPRSLEQKVEFGKQEIIVFPTRVVMKTKKRVSAIALKVKASSEEIAKIKALSEVMLICVLLTLSNRNIYKTTHLPNRKNVRKLRSLTSLKNVNLDMLYPIKTGLPIPMEIETNSAEKFNYVWNLYKKLTKDKQEEIQSALYAYYTGLEIIHKQPTLSIVAFIAGLGSLASKNKVKCKGVINCSFCEVLPFQHDIIGDRASITDLVSELLNIKKSDDLKKLKKLIQRIYTKHRSAYVHSAILRYEEFHKKDNLPSAFPTENEPVRDLYFYYNDLLSFERITRLSLLEWIANENGESLNRELVGLSEFKIEINQIVQANYSLPARRLVRLG